MHTSENDKAVLKSTPTLLEFTNKLKSDADLVAKYKELFALNDEQSIVDFMKANGVSDEDIKSFSNRELSDKELDEVNGGTFNLKPIFNIILKIFEQHRPGFVN